MRPYGPSGRPSCSRVHVSPPSVERQSPLPFPPFSRFHGKRRTCHMPAKSTLGLPGCITRSLVPVVSFTNNTFFHVLPPSVVRNTPRSALGFHTLPMAATNTRSALVGSMTIREIWPASLSPMKCQLWPASVERYTPCPFTTSLRMLPSPVPTHTMFGLFGASAIAPIDASGSFSNTAFHVMPPSSVLNTPPALGPT